jgi:uncharacterized protein
MADWLTRTTEADLELRGDGRTVVGIAMPFDVEAEITDAVGHYTEVFRRGAFARTIKERGPKAVKFYAQHQHQLLPLGRASVLREDANGLYAELRASKTAQADEVLELIRDGAVDALSIGFRSDKGTDKWNASRTHVERLSVRLHEISAVAFPAFADAVISGIRSATYDPSSDPERRGYRLRLGLS